MDIEQPAEEAAAAYARLKFSMAACDDDEIALWGVLLEDSFGARFGGLAWESDRGVCVYLQEPLGPEDALAARMILGERIADDGAVEIERVGGPKEWREAWRSAFEPIRVGDFVVVTPWQDAAREAAKDGAIPTVIEPEMAFGTGQHATTQLCLRLLSEHRGEVAGARVADIGAGSSILSIAAAKLGAAAPHWATEIDPDSERNARENWVGNGLDADALDYRVVGEIPDAWLGEADWALCNMLKERFRPLLPRLTALLSHERRGRLLLSGYLESEREEVSELAAAAGLSISSEAAQGDWMASIWHASRSS